MGDIQTDTEFALIRDVFATHCALLLHNQEISDAKHMTLARRIASRHGLVLRPAYSRIVLRQAVPIDTTPPVYAVLDALEGMAP